MAKIDVGGLSIAYERVGQGPPLVLLHGYVGDGPTTWRPQLDELGSDYTVVAWDAPGAGRSSDPPDGYGMAGYADCLAGFIRALGLDRPHVAGLSFGGAMALALAHRHPTVPRTLTLASAYAGWGGSLPAEEAEHRLRQALALSDLAADELVGALLPSMFSTGTPPDTVAAFGRSLAAFLSGRSAGDGPSRGRGPARRLADDLRAHAPGLRRSRRASATPGG